MSVEVVSSTGDLHEEERWTTLAVAVAFPS